MIARWSWVGVCGVVLAGCPQGEQGGGGGAPGAPVVTVAQPVVEQIVEWDAYTGRFAAVDAVRVRSRVSGYLKSVHFEEGQRVEAGEVLFVIDPRPFEVEVSRARAAVRQAEAQLAVARAQEQQAQADLGRVQAQLDLAGLRERRAAELRQGGTGTQEVLDERRSERAQVEAQLHAAEATIESTEAVTEAVGSAEADLVAARVELDGARLELSYTRVRAAVAGRADRHFVTVGNYVQGGSANGTELTSIVSTDPIHCNFDANEQALLRYTRLDREGARQSAREAAHPVYVGLVDESGFPHQGHMDFVANQLDEDTATIRGRAIFPNTDGLLQPGMFGRVRIPGTAPYEAVLIPESAVGADQSDRYVLVVERASGSVERRVVELGPRHGGLRVVRAGVEAGDWLVVEGVQGVRPGTTVEVEETEVEGYRRPEDLPDTYAPVPRAEWLSRAPSPPPAEGDEPALPTPEGAGGSQ